MSEDPGRGVYKPSYLARPADEGGSCTAEDIYWREQASELGVVNDLGAVQPKLRIDHRSSGPCAVATRGTRLGLYSGPGLSSVESTA